jgi:hypothetical protein
VSDDDVVANIRSKGPSYDFWLRVQEELDLRSMSIRELVERSGVQHTVIAGMQYSGIRNRSSRRNNVMALARVLDIPEDEALVLAGLAPPQLDPSADVRAAIRTSAAYDEDEKEALYRLLDVFDRNNAERSRKAG